jgi:MscS family membrane protein
MANFEPNSRWRIFLLGCALLSIGLALSAPAQAARAPAPPTGCPSPRAAVETVFYWLELGRFDPARAAECLDGQGRSARQLEIMAQKIRSVYGERGLRVDPERLSEESDWVHPVTGRAEVAPHPDLPAVVVRRSPNGLWYWPRSSLDRVNVLDQEKALVSEDFIARLPDWMRNDVLGIETWQFLALSALFVIGLVVRKVIQFVVKRRVSKLVERLGRQGAANLVATFASPGATLVMAVVLRMVYPQLRLPYGAVMALNLSVRMMVVVSLVWAAYRFVDVIADALAQKAAKTESKLDDQLVPLVRKALKIVTVVAGVLSILQNLNVNVASLLAGLGIGGVAVALAAKDTVANFFGSVMIFIDKPFQIGDWVSIAGVDGIVEEVGFRSTRVRTFYNSLVTIPNAKFTEASIDNYGRRQYRRTFITLNLTYDTRPEQMQAFVEGVRAIIQANPHTRKDYYEVHMSGFGAHSLDVMVYFFFQVPTWSDELRERHYVFLEILRLAKELGVEFAFPTRTLHIESAALPGAAREVPPPTSEQRLAEICRSFGPEGALSRPSGPKVTEGFFAAK